MMQDCYSHKMNQDSSLNLCFLYDPPLFSRTMTVTRRRRTRHHSGVVIRRYGGSWLGDRWSNLKHSAQNALDGAEYKALEVAGRLGAWAPLAFAAPAALPFVVAGITASSLAGQPFVNNASDENRRRILQETGHDSGGNRRHRKTLKRRSHKKKRISQRRRR